MNRRSFSRLALTSAAASFGCRAVPSVAPATWPGVPFDAVHAFVYACEADRDKSFLRPDGSLHPGILNGSGVLLSRGQTNRLLAAGRRQVKPKGHTACYVPHHAFLFSSAGKPVACMEICFTCHRHQSIPGGLPQDMDYDALWTILHELGVYADTTPGCYLRKWQARPA